MFTAENLVVVLLIAALVLVICGFAMRERARYLWGCAVACAVVAVLVQVFIVGAPGAGAAAPWSRAEQPLVVKSDMADPQLSAFALTGVQYGPTIPNSSNNSSPGCRDVILPQYNETTPLHLCAITARPEGGGGQWLVYLYTIGDGILAVYDMNAATGSIECFGADPWPSRFSQTLKVVVNCRAEDTGNGNDRRQYAIETDIPAFAGEGR